MEIVIRPATSAEIPALAAVYVRAWDNAEVTEKWTQQSAESFFRFQFALPSQVGFVAESDGRLVGGFFSSIMPWWDGNHLFGGELFVDPDFQQQGVGRSLMKALLNAAATDHAAVAWDLITFRQREFPRSWYESLGFTETEEQVFLSGSIAEALRRLAG